LAEFRIYSRLPLFDFQLIPKLSLGMSSEKRRLPKPSPMFVIIFIYLILLALFLGRRGRKESVIGWV
jgi:hypothetical protein